MPSAVMTITEVSTRIGVSDRTLRRRLPCMIAAGFPEKDPILKGWLRDDVEAWLTSRCKIKNRDSVESGETNKGVDYDAL